MRSQKLSDIIENIANIAITSIQMFTPSFEIICLVNIIRKSFRKLHKHIQEA